MEDLVLPPRRIPNLGHAALFTSFTGLVLILFQLILSALGKTPATVVSGVITLKHPILQLGVMASTYIITLAAAFIVFPLLWNRSFLEGVQWNFAAARSQASRLVALGLILGFVMQLVTQFVKTPKSLPVDEFFLSPAAAWLVTLFGTILAPIFEEICFRGFLLPAFAIAYDWFALPRTPEDRSRWQTTATLTVPSLIFSAVLSSFLFALLHAEQVAHQWSALLALFSISLILTYVRVRTKSVAASVLVHSAYNGFIFLAVIFATGGYRHLDRLPR